MTTEKKGRRADLSRSNRTEDEHRAIDAPLDLWDAKQVAKVLGVVEATARRLYYRGELRGVRVGALLRFDPRDVAIYIERAKSAPPA